MSRSRKKHDKRRKDAPSKNRGQDGGGEDGRHPEHDDDAPQAAPRKSAKWPVLKAVLIFIGVMAGYYAVDYYTTLLTGQGIQTYLAMIARSAAAILRVFGYNASTSGTAIVSPEFSVQIVRGCDALDPTVAFIAAVLASPVSFRLKIPGLLVGTISLLLINLVRIVSLFYVGVHFREIFDVVHYELWQAGFIALAIVFWAMWVQWATKRLERVRHAPA